MPRGFARPNLASVTALMAMPSTSRRKLGHRPPLPISLGSEAHLCRRAASLLLTKEVIHTVDAAAEQHQPPSARLGGARSHITVPMLKDDELVGAFAIYRQEVRPFTEKQI